MEADLWHCPVCDLIKSDLKPQKEIYNKEYARKYFNYAGTDLGDRLNEARWELVREYIDRGKLLDYGCGVGHFIKKCPFLGMEIEGYDINPHSGFFMPRVIPKRYDAITMWDVLEHSEDPIQLINSFNCDTLFVTTPNASLVTDIPKWKHYYPHEHVVYFTVDSLIAMFLKLNFVIHEINYMEGEIRSPEHPEWLVTVVTKKHL